MADNDDFDDFFGRDDVYHDAAFAKAIEEAERRAGTSASAVPTQPKPTATSTSATLNRRDPVAHGAVVAQRNAVSGGAGAAGQKGPGSGASSTSSVQTGKLQQPVPQKINRPTGTSSIIVSTKQKGNPVLTYIKNIPWEYDDIVPDYVVGKTTCALFLSLKYHRLHPEYIYGRIKLLGNSYNLRILLVMVDIDNHQSPLLELSKTCHINNLTLILCWTSAEAGRYLETYKSLENAAPTLIQEKPKADYTSRVVDVCTAVRSVNKRDAVSLVTNFGSIKAAMNAGKEEVVLIQGWGAKKAERWERAAREPFRVRRTMGRKEGEERIGSLERARTGDAGALARKLGIGPVILPESMTQAQTQAITIHDDEDEDSIIAEREREREEKERNASTGGGRAGHDGIMDALAKLRAAG